MAGDRDVYSYEVDTAVSLEPSTLAVRVAGSCREDWGVDDPWLSKSAWDGLRQARVKKLLARRPKRNINQIVGSAGI